MCPTRQRGFTMVELVVVLVVFSVILGIAIPNYLSLVRHTRAAQAVADLYAVRAAGFTYFAENSTWPRDYNPGAVPRELVNYLPRAFSFRNKYYMLDWENWRLPNGGSRFPQTGILMGVSIVTGDRQLLQDITRMLSALNFRQMNRRKSTLEVYGVGGI